MVMVIGNDVVGADPRRTDRDEDDYRTQPDELSIQRAYEIIGELQRRLIRAEQLLELKVDADRVKAAIVLSPEDVFIKGENIAIAGQVTIADFIRDQNGEATGVIDPKITRIIGDKIQTGVIYSNNWGTSAGSKYDLDNGTITLGGSSSPKFSVTSAGVMSCSGASINGAITGNSTLNVSGYVKAEGSIGTPTGNASIYGNASTSVVGVYGNSATGTGVYGRSTSGYAIYAQSINGTGVYVDGKSGGIYAKTPSSSTPAIHGYISDTFGGTAIYGNGLSSAVGVHGKNDNTAGTGVKAESSSGTALDVVGKMKINNDTLVTNLNADKLDGYEATSFLLTTNYTIPNMQTSSTAAKFQYSNKATPTTWNDIYLKRVDWT